MRVLGVERVGAAGFEGEFGGQQHGLAELRVRTGERQQESDTAADGRGGQLLLEVAGGASIAGAALLGYAGAEAAGGQEQGECPT